MIVRWSGREANALRAAMRLSIDDFARHVQVSARSVARWAQRGERIRLRWDVQRLLDGVLAAAGPQVHARLADLLATAPRPEPDRTQPDLPDLIDALIDSGPDPDSKPDREPHHQPPATGGPRLIHLEKAIARTHMDVQSCRYGRAGGELPGLLRQLAMARNRADIRLPARVGKLSADAYLAASDLLLKLGDVPMAMLAAQRCEIQARASGQPLAIAAAQRATVRVLVRCGRGRQAAGLARRAAAGVAAATTLDGPRPLSAYGALLVRGAVAHAAAGQRGQAMTLLSEASGIAERLGRDANFGWTAFDPADVALHRISALLRLDDPGSALRVARELDPDRIRLVERRAACHLGMARAWHRLGDRSPARDALRQAETIAPDEVHLNPANRALADQLGL